MANKREIELRKGRCCFTGHRPENLKQSEQSLRSMLEEEIMQAINDGFTVFISGMARGIDIWAAEIVLELKREGRPLRLICALPYDGFGDRWSIQWREKYHRILNEADLVRVICKGYHKGCFQIRNEWMVNHSARVIALYTGEPGGTRNTVNYAEKCGVEVRNAIN